VTVFSLGFPWVQPSVSKPQCTGVKDCWADTANRPRPSSRPGIPGGHPLWPAGRALRPLHHPAGAPSPFDIVEGRHSGPAERTGFPPAVYLGPSTTFRAAHCQHMPPLPGYRVTVQAMRYGIAPYGDDPPQSSCPSLSACTQQQALGTTRRGAGNAALYAGNTPTTPITPLTSLATPRVAFAAPHERRWLWTQVSWGLPLRAPHALRSNALPSLILSCVSRKGKRDSAQDHVRLTNPRDQERRGILANKSVLLLWAKLHTSHLDFQYKRSHGDSSRVAPWLTREPEGEASWSSKSMQTLLVLSFNTEFTSTAHQE
jgi:hypothetical protein